MFVICDLLFDNFAQKAKILSKIPNAVTLSGSYIGIDNFVLYNVHYRMDITLMTLPLEATIPVSCNKDCGAGCALLAHVQNGRIIKITDNPLIDAHMKGCIRGYHMPEAVHSDKRLKRPLLQTGTRGSGAFIEISWQEAFDRISEKLGEIRETHGCESLLAFSGSGSNRGAIHNTGLLVNRFFSLFGGYTGRNDSYSCAAAVYAEKYTIGFEDLSSYIMGNSDGIPKDPAWAERICGVPAETITRLAHTYGAAKPAALLPGLSIQRTLGGEETYRFSAALQTATGNIGRPGGSSGGEFNGKLPRPHFPQLPVPETAAFVTIPIYTWPDAVLEGKTGGHPTDIKAIYNVGTNYLNQGSDIKKNIRAFNAVDLVVTHDYFMTPTARYSDIILPVTHCFEREDVVIPADNYLFYSGQAIEPLYESKNDYDILCELSDRLGFGSVFSENKTSEQWLAQFMAESDVEDTPEFKTTGIFKGEDHMRVGLSNFIEDPVKNPLSTPSGKIEIRSENYAATGFSPIPEIRITQPEPDFPFSLITPHARFRINSQNANLSWTEPFKAESLQMNRLDGEKRNISKGERVKVLSPEGEMIIAVNLSDDIIQGTVCLLQGSWTRMDHQGIEIGSAANALTSTTPTLPCHGSRTHSVSVRIEKYIPAA